MMASTKVACPLCNIEFPSSVIMEHASRCLGEDDSRLLNVDNDRLYKKRKLSSPQSGWGFMMNDSNTVSKKMKITPEKRTEQEMPIITIDQVETTEITGRGKIDKSNTVVLDKPLGDLGRASTSQNGDAHVHIEKPKSLDLTVPLAEQMRPKCFENYIGQEKALGKDKMMWSLLQSEAVPSMILWGPPGCGKTTLANIIGQKFKGKAKIVRLSATSAGVNDVKEIVKNAKNDLKMFRKRTILFLDEIHRFNKLQQDSLLPHVEDGTITLIGATTENPSFQVNTALLSRCRVIVLDKLDTEAIGTILRKAVETFNIKVVEDEDKLKAEGDKSEGVCIEKTALEFLAAICDGDARAALNGLQMTVQSQLAKSNQSAKGLQANGLCSSEGNVRITTENVKEGLQRSHIAYDKTGEEHYNMISALHKSMRGSSDSAALYWLARMMEGGEEPLYIARRLIEFASEDVGLADPQALMLAVSTYQACHFIGRPECEKPLAECVVYLARAPKSVESYEAYMKAKAAVLHHQGPLPGVPLHLRNAPTKLMKTLGYGKGYKYNPAFKGPVEQEYFPECMAGTNFFK